MENIFELILVIAFGAIFGSYATLFAYRLPRNESCFGRYFGKKSRCPSCGVTILTRDLIPLLNWIITCGKCRSCKTKIPRIHLFVEFATTILFVFSYLNFGFNENFILSAMISVSLVVMLACDITHKKFTNQALLFLLFFVYAKRVLLDQTTINIVYSLMFGVLCSALLYHFFYKKMSYIFEDEAHFFYYIKFILIASIALDYQSFLFYFFEILITLLILSMLKFFNRSRILSIAYVFVIPLAWMLIIQPINY